MISMDGDFFQLLRRVQKEERTKSTLARVDKDFYKQLYSYIRDLERSVAKNPFDTTQSNLLNNAQRIATEICQWRESKISKAANNNIYRSFHLFKKGNPQFDLIDTTPLHLTPEEETLYFALMDALKTHRYNISLDKFGDEKADWGADDYEDEEEDDFEEVASVVKSRVNKGVVSDEEFFNEGGSSKESVTDGFSGESISFEESGADSVVQEPAVETPVEESSGSGFKQEVQESAVETTNTNVGGSDEVLDRLNQIKNSTVVTDEKYEPIEKQINNQAKVVPNVSMSNNLNYESKNYNGQDNEFDSKLKPDSESNVESEPKIESKPKVESAPRIESKPKVESAPKIESEPRLESKPKVGSEPRVESKPKVEPKTIEDRPKRKSSSTLDFDSIFANPDSQFDSIHNFEPDYEADLANIQASSSFAEPSEADLMFSTKPRPKKEPKPKSQVGSKEEFESRPKVEEPSHAPTAKAERPRSQSIKAFAKKEELENTTVVIYKNIDSFMGIDEKIYGPFIANDVVILPNITAQILIDNNKAGLIDI